MLLEECMLWMRNIHMPFDMTLGKNQFLLCLGCLIPSVRLLVDKLFSENIRG